MVRMRCRLHRVGGDAHISVGPILEADRARKSGSEFTVNLAFGCTCADCGPGNQIGYVLGRRHIEELCRRRQTKIVHGGKHVAGETQALVDVEAAIQLRIVDQPLPPHGGTWLLEIDAHDNFNPVGKPFAQGSEARGIIQGRGWIVD